MNGFLDGIPMLEYGSEKFVVSKFSGFKQVDFSYNFLPRDCAEIHIKYSCEIYFSGRTLNLHCDAYVPRYSNSPAILFKNDSNVAKFIFQNQNSKMWFYEGFKKSEFKSGKPEDVIPDIVRWFAKETNTKNALDSLKSQIEYVFSFIDKHWKK